MNTLITVLLFVLGLFLAIMIPPAIGYLLIRWIRWAKWLILLGVLIFIYFVFRAFYPEDGFYTELWEQQTHLALPSNTQVLEKDASFPDLHGDFRANSLFIIPAEIRSQFIESLKSVKYTRNCSTSEVSAYTKNIGTIQFKPTICGGLTEEGKYENSFWQMDEHNGLIKFTYWSW